MVAVGIYVHEWAVIKPPYFHEFDTVIGRRYFAFQQVFTHYKLL